MMHCRIGYSRDCNPMCEHYLASEKCDLDECQGITEAHELKSLMNNCPECQELNDTIRPMSGKAIVCNECQKKTVVKSIITHKHHLEKCVCVALNTIKIIGCMTDLEFRIIAEHEPHILVGLKESLNIEFYKIREVIRDSVISYESVKMSYDSFKELYLEHNMYVEWCKNTLNEFEVT